MSMVKLLGRFHKSLFYFVGLPHSRLGSIKNILEFFGGSFPFTYLGVLIFLRSPIVEVLCSLANKFWERLSSWLAEILSLVGKCHLIKSIMESSLLHSSQTYKWPIKVLRRMRVGVATFIGW